MEIELKHIIQLILEEKSLPVCDISFRTIPFKGTWGLGCNFLFPLMSSLKERGTEFNREELTTTLIESIKSATKDIETIDRIELEKGFVNFYFKPSSTAKKVLKDVLSNPDSYGKGPNRDIKVMVEYSQPNTHKDIHIGHLRNICLGVSLVNILRFAGYNTTSANYLGDLGTHVIKCLWGYQRFYQGMEPTSGRGRWLGEVYAFAETKYQISEQMRSQATELLKTFFSKPSNGAEMTISKKTLDYMKEEDILLSPNIDKKTLSDNMAKTLMKIREEVNQLLHSGTVSLSHVQDIKNKLNQFDENSPIWNYLDEVISISKGWEEKDPDVIDLWRRTRDWSLAHFNSIYNELGADFDVVFYESDMEEPGKEIVKDLLEKEIAEIDEGATVVKLDEKLGIEKETFKTFLILKSDKSSLYATKDLALAKKKFQDYDIDRSIYLVDVSQSFYFQQLFKTLELVGFEQAKNCIHLAYGRVSLPDGKMSSRLGNVIHYTDLRNELIKRAKSLVKSKQPHLKNDAIESIAKMISFGAMKYNMVKIDSDKDIVFDWEEALDYDGRTAPYIQYAHARACNILEKANSYDSNVICKNEMNEPEIELAKKLSDFPSVVYRCASEAKPLQLATYVYELAQIFSDFYHRCPVMQEKLDTVKSTRLAMVDATRIVIAKSLELLGIDAPSNM